MRIRRFTTAGIGLLAAAAFGLAGCEGSGAPSGAASPSATASSAADPAAAAELATAVNKLGSESFSFTTVSGDQDNVSGTLDPVAGVGRVTVKVASATPSPGISADLEMRLVDKDMYLMLGQGVLPGVGGGWLHLDGARLPNGNQFGLRPGGKDPAGTARVLQTATDVRRGHTGIYTGTLDLSRLDRTDGALGTQVLDQLGDGADRVPFQATLDDQGRLTELKLTLTAQTGGRDFVTRYSDYGAPVDVSRPDGDVTEAPAAVYTLLGGN
ncbi:hypothetical protein [Rhizomonospora bruguierae]|uniref:hypothetical protein n=1 Tax=Rhizomonospora bruguierae TaxID=1581705 RepID=UPI001BCF6E13|nr:hypothetical protein [Micromonospora sp. NBRC 107566]